MNVCMLGFLVNLLLSICSIFLLDICISCGVNDTFVRKKEIQVRNVCNDFKSKPILCFD